ncbi:hypothetical protein EJB05_24354 [Eragrostis curvula]|uniref:Protein kinase domain-containing protein n=1 Tax=Eragrostis curvula TaxID=38414 RepID=A0A5J9V9F0_9POAL|nr:hypothetical protein EJB05_24354 [Eragrostis curvula]
MDGESGRHDILESILHNQSSEPHNLPLEYLRKITNDFNDEQLLGEGGFGKVYKGLLQNEKLVAVKKLDQLKPGVQEKQFENEVYHLMRLKHPNIVRFLGYCYETKNECLDFNGKYIFAEMQQRLLCLEYLSNGSLDVHLSGMIITFFCMNGTGYILQGSKDETLMLKCRGYMAPEYIYSHVITTKADIYSLGAIIIEIITGKRIDPFSFNTVTSYQDFVEAVLQNWSNRVKEAPSETGWKQIKCCLEIGLSCVKVNRNERPTTREIIDSLNRGEGINCYVNNAFMQPADKIMSNLKDLLEITPLELRFCLELNKRIPCLVQLTNKTDHYVAFNFGVLRTTSLYYIEPPSGFMRPRSTSNVTVTMEERPVVPQDWQCYDEFLVQSVIVKGDCLMSEHNTGHIFSKTPSDVVDQVKLTVVYVQSPLLPSSSGLNDIDYKEDQDNNDKLAYWLSNSSILLVLLQRTLKPSAVVGSIPRRRRTSTSLSGRVSTMLIQSSPQSTGTGEASDSPQGGAVGEEGLPSYLGKLYGMIRDNLKKDLSPLLGLCIQAPRTSRASLIKGSRSQANALSQQTLLGHWQNIVKMLTNYLNASKANYVFSNGEYVKAGLAELEQWCRESEQYAGCSWDELAHIRQAVGFLVIHEKPKFTLKEITSDLCPVLSIQQLYRISTMYWDDKYGTHTVSSDVISGMRIWMTEESNNAVSSSFLLDDDSSIPFEVDDITLSVREFKVTDVDIPPSILEQCGLAS